jgi:citrate lyase subunit beta/citryl-CoA lyase
MTGPVEWARSFLFVPGDRPDRFATARASGADAVVLDLEDGVRPDAREAARRHVAEELAQGAGAVVRLSCAHGPELARDLAAVRQPSLTALLVPKAADPRALSELAAALPGVPVIALVETAAGVLAAPELARVEAVRRLALGALDLEQDAGIAPDPDTLRPVRVALALASRAAGLRGPVDGVCPDLHDPAATAAEARDAARAGFRAKLCVHPRQVAAVNDAFSPSAEDLAWGRRVLAAAAVHGAGAFRLDGQMVDRPVLRRAQDLFTAAHAHGTSPADPIDPQGAPGC